MALEDVEDLTQQFGREPAHGFDVYDSNASFNSDGLYSVAFAARHDFGSSAIRIERIEHPHGNIAAHGGHQRRWMQHLGAKIGEIGRFVKTHSGDAAGVGAEIWIASHDAVHVGPDFDALGVHACAHNRCAEIRTSTTQRGGNAVTG